MSPEERIAEYNNAVQILNDYTAQEAAKIGNAQASLGLMAERVARPSGMTSGLANYTYNRTLRPTIDSLAANLTTTGRSQALEKQLYDALTAAKNNYDNARNGYTVASTTPNNNNNNGGNGLTDRIFGSETDTGANQIPYTAAGTVTGVGSSGNGVYDITVADGKGGYNRYQFIANSREEALNKYYSSVGRNTSPFASTSSSGGGDGISGGGGGGGGMGGW